MFSRIFKDVGTLTEVKVLDTPRINVNVTDFTVNCQEVYTTTRTGEVKVT